MKKKRVAGLLAATALLLSAVCLGAVDVYAQEGIVPSGRDGDFGPDGFGSCELVATINNTIRFLVGITGILAVIAFMYAGFTMVSSRGDAAMIQQAKQIFANVLIGFVILLSAFLIVNTIMSMLVGDTDGFINWNRVECTYAREAGTVGEFTFRGGNVEIAIPNMFMQQGWTVVNRHERIMAVGSTSSDAYQPVLRSGAGSCSVITDSSNECAVSKLGCFGSQAEAASRVCNLESHGGQASAMSGTDLCKTGHSFSGGLFQINVLANHRYIPECSGDFFNKNGSSAQGSCLVNKTNSNGISYCAVRDCAITNESVYTQCVEATLDARTNLQIACDLYQAAGDFRPWVTSARACNVM